MLYTKLDYHRWSKHDYYDDDEIWLTQVKQVFSIWLLSKLPDCLIDVNIHYICFSYYVMFFKFFSIISCMIWVNENVSKNIYLHQLTNNGSIGSMYNSYVHSEFESVVGSVVECSPAILKIIDSFDIRKYAGGPGSIPGRRKLMIIFFYHIK